MIDEALDRWNRLDEQGTFQHLAALRADFHFLGRLLERRVPEPVARIDRRHFRQQTALAVADDDHLVQRRIAPRRVQGGNRILQRIAQQQRGVRNRIARFVTEEPELEMVADARVAPQVVQHLGPAHGARRRPVDKDDGNAAGLIRLQCHQSRRHLLFQQAATQEAAVFELPDRHSGQHVGERGGILHLQRNLLVIDQHRSGYRKTDRARAAR